MVIVFAADENYAEYLGVAILSIIDNNTSCQKINFYILTADMSTSSQKKLALLTRRAEGVSIEFIFIDEALFANFPSNIKHITKVTYFRYLIAELLPQEEKAIYLDVDIIVLGDLGGLWLTNINRFFIAGSHKDYFAKEFPGYKERIGLKEDDIYINAGVILLNLQRIRKFNKTQELFENTRKLRDIIRIQDQDIINITFNKGIKNVSNIYNYTESDRRGRSRDDKEIVIAHFNTSNKPWGKDFQYTDTNRYFANEYHLYRNKLRAIAKW